MKRIFICFLAFAIALPLFGAGSNTKHTSGSIESTSRINWVTRQFISQLSLDTQKEGLQMPSGKKKASASISIKMPQLIQPPLLSLYTDSANRLANYVINEDLTLDQVYNFIMNGYKTPDVFSKDIKSLNTSNTLKVDDIGKFLVNHREPYTQEEPIDTTPSRAYSGIIIDARGSYPVHGEYVKSQFSACFFPKIWDENMNVIFEKSMEAPEVIKNQGFVAYHYSDNTEEYEDRIGSDPLYIKAIQVFGRNRTDPVIKRSDALKILTIPENTQLLKDGKVVILLDKENLIFDIATPEKDDSYYVKYEEIKNYFYTNKVFEIDVSDTIEGILFSVDLKFYPDSPDLLPGEAERVSKIAVQLKDLLFEDGYTILIEGHTADVGKPVGQLNLSIERTRTVMNLLIKAGISEDLFSYKGYGGTMPVASNATEEGRAQNRRVDITARPRATYIQRDW
ncbi:MAG: OmpA family protein [Treponema sp.]|nr:OmpA family protein [Treponema sp.]